MLYTRDWLLGYFWDMEEFTFEQREPRCGDWVLCNGKNDTVVSFPNTAQIITDQFCSDINSQLENSLRTCLEKNGFDFLNYDRILVNLYEHFDHLNEMWLDGVCILKWSKFSFEQVDNKMIGSFEYIEL